MFYNKPATSTSTFSIKRSLFKGCLGSIRNRNTQKKVLAHLPENPETIWQFQRLPSSKFDARLRGNQGLNQLHVFCDALQEEEDEKASKQIAESGHLTCPSKTKRFRADCPPFLHNCFKIIATRPSRQSLREFKKIDIIHEKKHSKSFRIAHLVSLSKDPRKSATEAASGKMEWLSTEEPSSWRTKALAFSTSVLPQPAGPNTAIEGLLCIRACSWVTRVCRDNKCVADLPQQCSID